MSMAIKQSRAATLSRSPYVHPGMTSIRATTMRAAEMGDPGLFGFIGDALKTVGKAVGVIPGVGTIAGTALGAAGSLLAPQQSGDLQLPRGTAPPLPGLGGLGQRIIPGGATGYGFTDQELRNWANRAGKPAAKGPGWHYNKSSYWLKDGTFVPAGSKAVRNRKRNPLNPRALDRAMGRLTSAKRASKKIGRITIRKATACR